MAAYGCRQLAVLLVLCALAAAVTSAASTHQGTIDVEGADGSGVKTRQLLQATLPPNVSNPDPVAAGQLSVFCLFAYQNLFLLRAVTHSCLPGFAEAQCCSILQSVGFTVTPGIPVFIVDTNGQNVGGTGIGQDGQATNGNNGQASSLQPMQMCTCSAGVTNATYSGSGQIRLRGGNNSGKLVFNIKLPAQPWQQDCDMIQLNIVDSQAVIRLLQQCEISHASSIAQALRDTIREYYIKVANNEALGGLPADNGWVLRGLQNDTMGLHEFLAMNISRGAGWWAPRTQYIEVFLITNGQPINMADYEGLILLEEHIDQSKPRLNLAKLKDDDHDITGGYILEYRHGDNFKNEPTINSTITGIQWCLKYPDTFNMTKLNYIQQYVNNFEAALFGPNFMDPVTGWRMYGNPTTFVDFFLTTEIIKNAKHTYHGTSFANKDKGKVLDMGPTWSPKDGFGLCCGFPVDGYENNGISNGTSGGSAISPSGWLFNICNETSRCADHSPAFPLAQWFIRLWDDPSFVQLCTSRWAQLRSSQWSDSSIAAALADVQGSILPAGLRDFTKWSNVLLAPYGATDPTAFYNQAFTTVSDWTLQRLAWLDGAFQGVTANGNQIVQFSSAPAGVATAG
ncbi:MAG: hypothetical protein FRX49_09423 [Trebouxia sp. A1-2]|nr:MAG: hypothetical protein FRX49_09423 [Trebouxia sp. A1-2]